MNSLRLIILALLICTAGCKDQDAAVNTSPASDSSATITHEDGWTIVSKEEDGDRVHWFIAPDVDGVSPAMFKKIINTNNKDEPAIKIVSECEAPKQLCDELGVKFREMSEKYQ